MKRMFHMVHAEARRRAIECVKDAPQGYVITVAEPTRSLEANAKLWATLTDVSEQVEWHGRKLSPESWKHVFTAALSKQDVVPGLNGDFVVLGKSTSQMSVREMSDLIELIHAFGAEHDVEFAEVLAA